MVAGTQNLHDRASDFDAFRLAMYRRRRELGLRQDELADLAECSTRFVHALEAGKQTVQLDKLVDVLQVLGLHLELRRGAAEWVVDTATSAGERGGVT